MARKVVPIYFLEYDILRNEKEKVSSTSNNVVDIDDYSLILVIYSREKNLPVRYCCQDLLKEILADIKFYFDVNIVRECKDEIDVDLSVKTIVYAKIYFKYEENMETCFALYSKLL